MRKWCATLAMGVLLALPLTAQQKDATTAYNWNGPSENTVATTGGGADFSIAPASPKLFALPAAAAGKPADIFSDWDNNPWNRGAWGRLTPKYEVAGLFSYINFRPGSQPDFNNYGATGSFAYNSNRWLGLVAEVGGYTFSRTVNTLPPGATQTVSSDIKGDLWTYLFGPRLNFRHFDHFVPFVEALFGDARGNPNITGDVTQSSFGLALGGGVDVVLSKNVSWRFAQIDYLMTNFSGPDLAASARQNNFRIGSGIVFRLGYPPAPPKPNHPPVAACSAAAPSVYKGSTDVVAIHVNASDPDNDPLTYTYTATGGTVDGTGPDARWNPTGLALGSYTINVKVDDGRGGTASCAADVAVVERPNRPPEISCSPERSPIIAGERVAIISRASDPDGDPLTFSYAATGGQISGTTSTAQFDSTGLTAGSYSITCTADDGRGGRTSAKTNVDVQAPAPPPQASKVGDCGYTKVAASRFDNACKRVGDDVALRLKNEPTSKLVIVGFADPKEPKATKLAETRAELAKKYLGEKGIDASRISTRAGAASTEKGMEKENRRVDFIFVPEGATY